ncbi:hypothetical protein TL16_g07060 [Triparma laevis f. inornata]|uniref:Helicase ATP-binding domain-containing protein n=1 Tax=Triparma laevis f. inornata TaxID=1714386 RepID=A0A9W7EF06_9STRA|nr:hypothetical protein TL16_g07060 [Triparma laevis f. inornata]
MVKRKGLEPTSKTSPPLNLPKSLPPSNLPIVPYHDDIKRCLKSSNCIILTSSTGSGKTTTIPFLAHTTLSTPVTCTQPRRVACTSVSTYVSSLLNVTLGGKIGYNIRFDKKISKETVISYQTDYMLLRGSASGWGRLFPDYGCVIIDEAHERSLGSDFLCSLVKSAMKARNYSRFIKDDSDISSEPEEIKQLRKIVRKRKLGPLKVVVMSATISATKFEDFFSTPLSPASVLKIPGKTHRIDVTYLKDPCVDFVEACVEAMYRVHSGYGEGDVLCFLPGREEIDGAVYSLRKLLIEREEGEAQPFLF